MRGNAGNMGIFEVDTEGGSLPFGKQKKFFDFPLSTPLPLDTASNYPRKEILKAVQMGGFFSARKSAINMRTNRR